MKILVSEYVSGGGWPDEQLPSSLWAEGKAMLQAVVTDFARLPQVQVACTWNERFGHAPNFEEADVQVLSVRSPAEEERVSAEWSGSATPDAAALIIAPEFDGILESRCERFRSAGVRLLNADAMALRMAGDKWKTFLTCQAHGIPTILTLPANGDTEPDAFPVVVKLRDGAGSLMMELLNSRQEWQQFCGRADLNRFLVQPYIAGRSCSVIAIVASGEIRHLFPTGEQRFSSEDRFSYQGGMIPARDVPIEAIRELVDQAIAAFPGLHGWIGFDLLLPHYDPGNPLLLEVNPRLTTSYVGYRKLCRQMLAKWLVDPSDSETPEFSGSVIFQADGQFRIGHHTNSELSQ